MKISIERRLELEEFCRQYPVWVNGSDISGGITRSYSDCRWSDRVLDRVEILSYISTIKECCRLAAGDRWEQLLISVTEDIPFWLLEISSYELQRFYFFLNDKI